MSVCSLCSADRLIHVPTGKKVPDGVFKIEASFDQNDLSRLHGYLDFGFTSYLDATVRTDDVAGTTRNTTIDLGYNYISPITDASPGISIGVQDALGSTTDGRRFYFASTFRVGLGGNADTFTPAEVSVGAYVGKKNSAFVGVMMPITTGFRILAEHDGYRLNSGIEIRPLPQIAVRYLFIGSSPTIGLQVRSKFKS